MCIPQLIIIPESTFDLNPGALLLADCGCIILISAMGLDDAYRKALEDMSLLNPQITASRSGVSFDDGKFNIPLFNRSFSVSFPDIKVEEAGSETPPFKLLEILLMHYLINADGTEASGMWITYRQLPGANLFADRFTNLVSRPMLESFGNDAEGLRQAGLAIGGQPMDRSGDVSFRFRALPKIPIGFILYLGDEEMPSSISILFDSAAPHYLPTEDLTILASLLHSGLKGAKRTKVTGRGA
jgi:hypothetical protein